MKRLNIDHNSIIVRLLFPMLAILLFQTILFSSSILYGGTIEELTNLSVGRFSGQVLTQKNYLQREITQRWSNLSQFENDIQSEVNKILDKYKIGYEAFLRNPLYTAEFLENTSQHVINALRQSMATGVFIVLMDHNDSEFPGVYIRDLDPSFNPNDNSDILMERGPSAIASNANYSLGKSWLPYFTLDEDEGFYDSFHKPFLAAEKYQNAALYDLGYWSRPYRLGEYDMDAISYSIPLLDKEGHPYGVIGIDLTLDYLRRILNYDELAENKQGAYLLAIGNDENAEDGNMEFENILVDGPIFKNITVDMTQTVFERDHKHPDIYRLKRNNQKSDVAYGSIHYLNLYNKNTPFEQDKWALVGIIKEASLLKSVRRVKVNIAISLLIVFVAGIAGILLVGIRQVKPITVLSTSLKESDPERAIVLEKTQIKEIDDLARAVELLSREVAESASKLSKIIGMVKLPIAAFEHVLDQNKVFCTEAFFDIVGVEKSHRQGDYISAAFFYSILNDIKKNPESDLQDIYRYRRDDGSIRWIRIRIQEDKRKVLGVIEDATEETREKRRIEYERDHDILTHLINRRAFHEQVTKIIQDRDVKIAAFVMWDLDNLKYINDTYGHDYGDEYIRTAAGVLREISVHNGIIGRVSGDEFHAFIYGYEDKQEIRQIVEKTQEKLYNTSLAMPDGTDFRIRASAGIAWYPDDSRNYHELIRFSDFAMYEIKNKAKGNVGEFNRNNYKKESFLLHGKAELNRLIDEELIKYVFQPIVDAKDGKIFAYEALMRPEIESLSSPMAVLKLAHSQSRLNEIERLTWFKVMETFSRHIKEFGDTKIFINSIPNHVLSYKDRYRLEKLYGEYLHRVVVEITESEQSDEDITRRKMDMINRWNSQLALDDFGSGYNSEIALLALSPAFIKIDMSIIRGIDKDMNRQKMLLNLLSYAKERHIKVIAEGVETEEEMKTLIKFGIDYMQGHYIGMPEKRPKRISEELIETIKEIEVHTNIPNIPMYPPL